MAILRCLNEQPLAHHRFQLDAGARRPRQHRLRAGQRVEPALQVRRELLDGVAGLAGTRRDGAQQGQDVAHPMPPLVQQHALTVLKLVQLLDVDRGAEPAGDGARLVAHREVPDEVPAVGAVRPADALLPLQRLAGGG